MSYDSAIPHPSTYGPEITQTSSLSLYLSWRDLNWLAPDRAPTTGKKTFLPTESTLGNQWISQTNLQSMARVTYRWLGGSETTRSLETPTQHE